ncbi:hypothetical protein C0991_007029 [Blastosporella zonata]|nr:hypothetical protein C0991_007029 [Blastosporella zonata]
MAFLLNIIAITVIQGTLSFVTYHSRWRDLAVVSGILVIRIWYLFQGSKAAQIGIIVGFVISVALSLVFLYLSANNVVIIERVAIQSIFPGIRDEGFSRVLFSIHSLADKLGSDSAWLLNNVELSRVGWRTGKHEGELIVESFTVYAEDDGDVESVKEKLSMKETRVGVFSEDGW